MKILKRFFDKNSRGTVKVIIEESDDLWVLYNIIEESDLISSHTTRKFILEDSSGSTTSKIQKTYLTLSVKKIDYDGVKNILRISGTNVMENDFVKKGAYHTFEFSLNDQIKIYKDLWDSIHKEKLQESVNFLKGAEVSIILVDCGISNIFLVGNVVIKPVFTLKLNIPKRRTLSTNSRELAINKFYQQIFDAVVLFVNFDYVKCCIVAGPGFTKDDFHRFMLKKAELSGITGITRNRCNIITLKTTTAYTSAINEILLDKVVLSKVKDLLTIQQVKYLNDFYQTLHSSPNKVCYGLKDIQNAVQQKNIETLLITDNLFRSSDNNLRKVFVKITEDSKKAGSRVLIYSDFTISGKQLNSLTGVAAILRHPVFMAYELEDESGSI